MSFDDHESCRCCGSHDSLHTLADCESRRKAASAPAIPSPAELRARRDTGLASAVDECVRRLVATLTSSRTLTARTSGERDVLDVAAERLRAAGWRVTVVAPDQRDGGGWQIVVSATAEVQP